MSDFTLADLAFIGLSVPQHGTQDYDSSGSFNFVAPVAGTYVFDIAGAQGGTGGDTGGAAPGADGTGGSGPNGNAGSGSNGGSGGVGTTVSQTGGGGGGGGFRGGGGGEVGVLTTGGGGGGGGSNWVHASATSITHSQGFKTGTGYVHISW